MTFSTFRMARHAARRRRNRKVVRQVAMVKEYKWKEPKEKFSDRKVVALTIGLFFLFLIGSAVVFG